MNELHGILTTYETRINNDKFVKKEVTFNTSKRQDGLD